MSAYRQGPATNGLSLDRHTISIFLSFPRSAENLAALAHDIISKVFERSLWVKQATPFIGKWNNKLRPVPFSSQATPNETIFEHQGRPQDVDLMIVLLTSTIGPGTIEEIGLRASSGKHVSIILKDEPPSRLALREGYAAAQAEYDAMHEWLSAPYWFNDGAKQPLDKSRFEPNIVPDPKELADRVIAIVEAYLAQRYPRSDEVSKARTDVYFGLRPLTEANAPYFFGREGKVAEIVNHWKSGRRRIIIVGGSGTGKSSLLGAGVIPALRAGTPEGTMEIAWVRPDSRPIEALAKALHSIEPNGGPENTYVRRFRRAIEETCGEFCHALARPLVVIVDQFEQTYSSASQEDSVDFFRALECLVESDNVTLIVGHRADQMHRWTSRAFLTEDDAATDAGRFAFVELSPMQEHRLRDVIVEPARKAELPLPDPRLVDTLLADTRQRKNSLPLLARALHELYKRSRRRTTPDRRAIRAIQRIRPVTA